MRTVDRSGTPAGESLPQSAGLRRDLEVLSELASEESLRRGGLGVVRIAERLGRDKSQVSRALRALEAEGMVERDPRTRTFQLGWALYTLAARGVETRLVRAATTWLRGLAEEQGRVVRLCVLIGGQVLSLVVVSPGRTYGRRDGDTPGAGQHDGSVAQDVSGEAGVPVTDTAAGPALLLDWPVESLAQLGGGEDLADRIDRVRGRGYAIHTDPDGTGRSGLAAPVYDFRGIVLAAIELTLSGSEAPAPRQTAVRAAAAGLSRDLGHELRS